MLQKKLIIKEYYFNPQIHRTGLQLSSFHWASRGRVESPQGRKPLGTRRQRACKLFCRLASHGSARGLGAGRLRRSEGTRPSIIIKLILKAMDIFRPPYVLRIYWFARWHTC